MAILHLKAENDCQQAIKEYLESNVSEILADKINNGVQVEKDGKTFVNKKTLTQFWNYASKKAQELKTGYVANDTVFGWAIHYFEESDIIGTLYNQDGTEYKPAPKPVQHVPAPTIPAKPTPPKTQQFNLFDMLSTTNSEEPVAEETPPKIEEVVPEIQGAVEKERYFDEQDVDLETGEILRFKACESDVTEDDFKDVRALQQFFDKDALYALYELFDYNLDMQ